MLSHSSTKVCCTLLPGLPGLHSYSVQLKEVHVGERPELPEVVIKVPSDRNRHPIVLDLNMQDIAQLGSQVLQMPVRAPPTLSGCPVLRQTASLAQCANGLQPQEAARTVTSAFVQRAGPARLVAISADSVAEAAVSSRIVPGCTELLCLSTPHGTRLLPAGCAAPHALTIVLPQIKPLGPSVFQDTVHMVPLPCSRPDWAPRLSLSAPGPTPASPCIHRGHVG